MLQTFVSQCSKISNKFRLEQVYLRFSLRTKTVFKLSCEYNIMRISHYCTNVFPALHEISKRLNLWQCEHAYPITLTIDMCITQGRNPPRMEKNDLFK